MSEVWRYKEYVVVDITEPVTAYVVMHGDSVIGVYKLRDMAIECVIDHMVNAFAEVLKPFAALAPSRPKHYRDEYPVFAINENNITFADIDKARSIYTKLSTGE